VPIESRGFYQQFPFHKLSGKEAEVGFMKRFARVSVLISSFAVLLSSGTNVFAQGGAPNNPLRNSPPPANSQQPQPNGQQANGGQPRVAQQPSGPVQVPSQSPQQNPQYQGQSNGGQPNGGQLNYGGQQNPGLQQQPNQAQQRQPGVMPPNQQPARPQQLALQAPFKLTPQQQADLDQLLGEWETQSNNMQNFSCKFMRTTYKPAFMGNNNQPAELDIGEIKYAAPDKGMFRVDKTFVYVKNPKTNEYEQQPGGDGEHWTCSGTSIYNVNVADKTIEEYPLPKQLQGKAITEGPLPFVFGAKAADLKARYFLRDITPQPEQGKTVWLQVVPKYRRDAQNFQFCEVILTKNDMLPYAIKVIDPGATPQNLARTVYTFEDRSVNGAWARLQNWLKDFSIPTKIGYKHVVKEAPEQAPPQGPPAAQAQQAQQPGAQNQPPQRQTFNPQVPARR
jgi:TIGR03009 family protein